MSISEELWRLGANVPTHDNFDSLDPENQRLMNADFTNYCIDPRSREVLHGLMSLVLKPESSSGTYNSYVDEAGNEIVTDPIDVEDAFDQWIKEGGSVICIGDHQHVLDHETDVAYYRSRPKLRVIPDRGHVLGKVEYFDIYNKKDAEGHIMPPTIAEKIINRTFRVLNTIPIIRPKDLERMIKPLSPEDALISDKIKQRSDTIRNATRICAEATEEACVNVLRNEGSDEGGILRVYIEGERKRDDWSAITDPADLVARVLKRAEAEGIKVAVLVDARSYGVEKESHWLDMNARRSHMHAGAFLKGSFAHKARTNKRIARVLQQSLSTAHSHALGHDPLPIDPEPTAYQLQYPVRFDRKTSMIVPNH